MAGKTLHIATQGFHVPPENAGSNPLALASHFHLGADVGIFGIALSPDLGQVVFDDLFDPDKNPLLVQTTNSQLTIVHGPKPDAMTPHNVIVRVGGVCYKLPLTISRRIRGKRASRVHWETTLGERGSFRFRRTAPKVF